ncbi:MAG: hypothetical protein V3V02_10615 [Rhizobiaceae bacterium]
MTISTSIRTTVAALFVSSAVVFTPTAASAFDATALLKRYETLASKQGQKFSYKSIEAVSDGGFTVTDPSWTIATLTTIKAATLTFSDIQEGDNDSLTIGSIDIGSITAGSPDVSVVFDSASMKGLRIPSATETDPIKLMPYYSRFEMGKGTISSSGKMIASMGGGYVDVSPFDANTPMKMISEITDIKIDTSAVPEKKFTKMVTDLGYGANFTGRIAMDATWSLSDGLMDLYKYDFVIDNVGTFSMPFKIGGYTAEKMQQMQQMNQDMEGKSEEEQGMAALALFADLTLHSMSISFKDDSLTDRGLKFASKQMGQPPEQLVQMAPMMIGMGMGQLKMPEVSQMVSEAVAAFLKKPGTLSISVKPEKPIAFTSIGVTGAADPKALVKLLNLQVTAK